MSIKWKIKFQKVEKNYVCVVGMHLPLMSEVGGWNGEPRLMWESWLQLTNTWQFTVQNLDQKVCIDLSILILPIHKYVARDVKPI